MVKKRHACAALVVVSSIVSACQSSVNEPPGVSPTFKQSVVASRGVIATNHPLASAAGQMILAKGGNAVDAIVAAYFALSVVEPAMSSPFGSGFINLYTEEGEAITLDNYTVAPGEATPDMYRLEHPDDEKAQAEAGHVVVDEENRTGFKAIGVPGNLEGLALGGQELTGAESSDLRQLMGPAIDFAKNGVHLSPAAALTITRSEGTLWTFSRLGGAVSPGRQAPEAGTLLTPTRLRIDARSAWPMRPRKGLLRRSSWKRRGKDSTKATSRATSSGTCARTAESYRWRTWLGITAKVWMIFQKSKDYACGRRFVAPTATTKSSPCRRRAPAVRTSSRY